MGIRPHTTQALEDYHTTASVWIRQCYHRAKNFSRAYARTRHKRQKIIIPRHLHGYDLANKVLRKICGYETGFAVRIQVAFYIRLILAFILFFALVAISG